MRWLSICFAATALGGCSTAGVVQTAQIQYATVTPELAASAAAVEVLGDAVPAGATIVGPVDAYACQVRMHEPEPTDELAIAMLRSEAAKAGARWIASVTTSRSNIDVARNCMTTIHAKGIAYR